jgi:hypothetical protein
MDRDEAIKRIRAGLKRRSGKSWSVTGGRGTAWGWITIISPPKRQKSPGAMTDDERMELGGLLDNGGPVHFQGRLVPASDDYRQEYVDRAEGRVPTVYGRPYWD